MSGVKRVYVEKKPEYAVQAKDLLHEVESYLGIKTITNVRVLNRYDIENLSEETFVRACNGVFAEPPVDILYHETFEMAEGSRVFSVEYLPGQFDQRADSAVQCVQFIKEDEKPVIKTATTYVIEGTITDEEFEAVKNHCINPVDSREAGIEKPETLVTVFDEPEDVKIFDGFKDMQETELKELYDSLGLAMTFKDFQHIQKYLVTVFDEPEDVKIFDGFKDMQETELKELYDSLGLAMTFKDFQHIQKYFNAVFDEPEDVKIFDGFKDMQETELKELYDSLGLAMTFKDFQHIQKYFNGEEVRDPSMTEIRVLDTYWSDHCRHTTFSTELKDITFGEGDYKEPIVNAYKKYISDHSEIFKGREDKFVCLMDLALMAMRKLKREGKLQDQEESDEINACSIVVPVEVDGVEEEWLVNFKNETHNHPTEIEPFGGAATCLGGAIRDPLSGRTYVYQAMRVTGAADPTVSVKETLKGKLPQKKLVTEAAHGYSSYGNQIGLATGAVKEIYHPDYVAKRMEIGAVLGAAPRRAVIRETSDPGDIIILLGGRTGRDGCGGATGSSKVHTEESIETCGAEVQKGNPPTERKIQRLFRREEVSKLIKKCNDFGAGGVSVAIGELADGLRVDLDKVPKKYAGLDGTEIAISESQERMAVVVDAKDVEQFLAYAKEENLEAVEVAVVTESPRLVLVWRGKEIVNISRAFLDTNGAHQETSVSVDIPNRADSILVRSEVEDVKAKWLETLSDLNVCSQKGLVERFDGSIGAGSVFMPHGGKYQMTETQAMVAKLPVLTGKCDTVTMMSYGFDPYLSSWSPYHGAVYAVLESVAKIVANGGDYSKIRLTFQEYLMSYGFDPYLSSWSPYHGAVYAVLESVAKIVANGGDYSKIRLTFQEYFRRMTEDPSRWSQPFAALLGAYDVQLGLGLPSIGGKDSMSGTFQDIDVPPTLVSFAVDVALQQDIITPELKTSGNKLVWLHIDTDEYDLPVYDKVMEQYGKFREDIQNGKIVSAYALDRHGIAAAVSKMAFGNGMGVKIEHNVDKRDLFTPMFGDIIAEVPADKVGELAITYTVSSCR